ncbi:hypothetical protein ACMHYJ_14230 [Castellaniella hirudinis]|uniref:hypothetical protein n=1 Tax=Castellaniella hirudinis TaxID=1144617 RepID=UPI0039C3BD44
MDEEAHDVDERNEPPADSMRRKIFKVLEGHEYIKLFREFSDAKGINNACPACGAGGWLVSSSPRTGYVTAEKSFIFNSEGRTASKLDPKLRLNCKNCGFERIFDLQIIAKWQEDRQNNSGTDDYDEEHHE